MSGTQTHQRVPVWCVRALAGHAREFSAPRGPRHIAIRAPAKSQMCCGDLAKSQTYYKLRSVLRSRPGTRIQKFQISGSRYRSRNKQIFISALLLSWRTRHGSPHAPPEEAAALVAYLNEAWTPWHAVLQTCKQLKAEGSQGYALTAASLVCLGGGRLTAV